jgi:NADH-quinone oxidoreductase subunit H
MAYNFAYSPQVDFPGWLSQLLSYLPFAIPSEVQLFLWAVFMFTGIAVVGQAAVVFMVLMERKVLAWLTQRKGPNRVGPLGLLQTLADGVKLLFKEDIMTPEQDKFLFTLAPAIFFLPVFVLYAFIPFTSQMVGLQMPTGALLFFALSSISVIGIVLAGWASNNKYSLLGGMRSAAQAISYEIPLVLSVLPVVLMTGSMNLTRIVEAQNGQFGAFSWNWFAILPVSFLVFLTASIAEVNRVPFDLPEAESELVSGYNTEYTGMKFAMFFLAEYAALFAMSAMTAMFFFGGYYSPLGGILIEKFGVAQAIANTVHIPGIANLLIQGEMISWMLIKTYVFIFLAMWIRGTLPRLKPDQLMAFSWKFLIPLCLINLFVASLQRFWILTQTMESLLVWVGFAVIGFLGFMIGMSNLFNRQIKARLTRV